MADMNRRDFLKAMAGGAALTLAACGGKDSSKAVAAQKEVPKGLMTYRENPKTKDKISLLGYGCMRLPTKAGESARDSRTDAGDDEIDQEMVNRQVDYALEHGVNYFDTSPAYCKGRSEEAMGIALSRHDRSKYFVATKLSNFAPETWEREKALEMYRNSFKKLQVDYIDYYLLHSVGGGDGIPFFNTRYMDNGLLDFLLAEREAGRIRNLGFSYHGDVAVFDHLLAQHDKYKWDFVQIQLNYVDWKHAKETNPRNTDAEYLYAELAKRNIPAVIMEPLLGGRLASINFKSLELLKRFNPDASAASWAFRFAGHYPGVMCVLSGMTYMEHLQENITTYSPLKPLSDEELATLELSAQAILSFPLIQCNSCQYCMPCPYGLDIPGIFVHYNKCLNEGNYAEKPNDENYAKARRAFLVGYDRAVPKLRQANHCTGCKECLIHCPQRIDIPAEMARIDKYTESLKMEV